VHNLVRSVEDGSEPIGKSGARNNDFLLLAVLAPLAGAGAGLICAGFRLALEAADRARDSLISWSYQWQIAGFLLVVAAAAASVAAAAWLVRRFAPCASGSGIPHVEAALLGEVRPATPVLIPVKFLGGLLAIGAGLALGREGPCVQMGAAIAHRLGQLSRCSVADSRILLAAGAGAGLAAAFNAPIAGAVFVLEELVRRFDTRITVAALGASAAAIAVARAILGNAPDFHVAAIGYQSSGMLPLYALLGAIAGVAGMAYTRAILSLMSLDERFASFPVEVRAALIGAAVGTAAWFLPDLVGGGDPITQATLSGDAGIVFLSAAFLFRFGLGGVSYAAAVPGGLFAPILTLGAQLGLIFGQLCVLALPGFGIEPTAFAVVGMAAFFIGVVQAPVTGIVLVIEMTASFTMLLPMLAAGTAAMLLPVLLRNTPIYDALRERAARHTPTNAADSAWNKERNGQSDRGPPVL
jgi:chloride channel protein, CIC family